MGLYETMGEGKEKRRFVDCVGASCELWAAGTASGTRNARHEMRRLKATSRLVLGSPGELSLRSLALEAVSASLPPYLERSQ